MGPFDGLSSAGLYGANSGQDNTNIQSPSSSPSPLSSLLNLTQSNGAAQSAAIGQGMADLSNIMQTVPDPQRAVLQYAKSPGGQQLMKIPGAFPQLLDEFRKSQTNINPLESANIPQNNAGVTMRGNQVIQSQNAAPTQYTTPSTSRSDIYQQGKGFTASFTNPSPDVQNFDAFVQRAGSTLTPEMAQNAAMAKGIGDRMATGQMMLNSGVPKDFVHGYLQQRYGILTVPEEPGLYYMTDTHQPGVLKQLPILGTPAATTNTSTAPTLQQPGAPVSSLGSKPIDLSPQGQSQAPQEGQQAAPYAVQQTANKYGVPTQAIKGNGTIDLVRGFGPGSLLTMGSGWPAMIQADTATVGQFFNPGDANAVSDLRMNAKAAQDGLQFLLGRSNQQKNRGNAALIQSVLDLGTEHEKDSSPQYAIAQLQNIWNTFGPILKQNQDTLTKMQPQNHELPYDKSQFLDLQQESSRIESVLNFLPPPPVLNHLKQAIQDGKIENLPSFAGAATSVYQTSKDAASAGMDWLFGNPNPSTINARAGDTISAIKTMSPKQLTALMRVGGDPAHPLSAAIQQAMSDRYEELLSGSKPMKYAPGSGAKRQGPSVKQFTQNPGGQTVQTRAGEAQAPPPPGQSNAMYNAQPQGNTPFAGLGTPNRRIRNAFQAIGQ